jgi:hypothetical protein
VTNVGTSLAGTALFLAVSLTVSAKEPICHLLDARFRAASSDDAVSHAGAIIAARKLAALILSAATTCVAHGTLGVRPGECQT